MKLTNFINEFVNKSLKKLVFRKKKEIKVVDEDPSFLSKDGIKYWFKNGLRHRDGDKPAIVDAYGTKYWFKNGKVHRDGDKPALVCDCIDRKLWAKNGKLHRENNPGEVYRNEYFYLNNKEFPRKEYWIRLLLMEY